MAEKSSHCSYCGHVFQPGLPFPRTCWACAKLTCVNPLPVAVLVLPVDDGVLTIRRGIEPRKEPLALPGGSIDMGEAWRAACARELREKKGIVIDAESVQLFGVYSAPDGTLLVFGVAKKVIGSSLPAFVATEETSERIVVTEAVELAFPLHTRVLRDFFARKASGR